MTDKIWYYNEPVFDTDGAVLNNVVLEVTEANILDTYWEYWKGKMDAKFGPNYFRTQPEFCIEDWVVVNWAWEKVDG
jgi:hypothetical protein